MTAKIGKWSFVVRYCENDHAVSRGRPQGVTLWLGEGTAKELARKDAIAKAAKHVSDQPSELKSTGVGNQENIEAMEIDDAAKRAKE